jgi:hypothetical protein
MWLIVALLTVSLHVPSLQGGNIQFTANATSIACGESITLRWSVPGAVEVYISGVGRVAATGERQVRPQGTTTYTILSEGPLGIRAKSITIQVRGCSRGPTDYPDPGAFSDQLRERREVHSYPAFLELTHRVLQDEMSFQVDDRISLNGDAVFITKPREVDIRHPDDEKNRVSSRRQLAYLVEVRRGENPAEVTYSIKTFIQYQKILGETWRPEQNEEIHRAEAVKLRDALNRR